jgi:co-chaperonin GroES (HSP10)
MKFNPRPGMVIIKPIKSNKPDYSKINLGQNTSARIKKGTVVAVGKDGLTQIGAILKAEDYAKVGDVMYFLSYDGNYDVGDVDGEEYHFTKFEDLRSTYEN